jgi:hypothetical protein
MTENEEVDRLKRRLNWEGAGPLAELSNRTIDAMTTRGQAVASWVRENAEDRPLISLLIAFQIGFAVGRWGPRRAKH